MRSEKKISPALERALGEIEKKELTLNDLPVARDAEDWGAINRSAELQLLELVALKYLQGRPTAAQQQQPPSGIADATQGTNCGSSSKDTQNSAPEKLAGIAEDITEDDDDFMADLPQESRDSAIFRENKIRRLLVHWDLCSTRP